VVAVGTTAGVALFELPTLRHLRFTPIDGGIAQVEWSPDAQQLALTSRQAADQGSDIIYRIADGVLLPVQPGQQPPWHAAAQAQATPAVTFAGGAPIFSPDASTIVTTVAASKPGGPGARTLVWRSDGTQVRTLEGDLTARSHDGTLLAISDGIRVSLWHWHDLAAPNGQPVRTFTAPIAEASGFGNALSFSPDDQALHAVLGHNLYSWRVADGTPLGTTPDIFGDSFTFEAQGAILEVITAGGDGPSSLQLIRTSDGATIYDSFDGSISYGDDNETIVVQPFENPLQVLDIRSGKQAELDLPGYIAAAFSPDAQTLALATFGSMSLWNVVDSTRTRQLDQRLLAWFDLAVDAQLSYSSDGRLLTYAIQRDNLYSGVSAAATTWDLTAEAAHAKIVETRSVPHQEPAPPALRSAFSPERGASAVSYDARHVEIQAAGGISLTTTMPVTVTALAFSPGGALLAIGDAAGSVRLVAPANGAETQILQSGPAVDRLVFSPDGALLAALRADGAAPVWQVAESRLLATLSQISSDAKLLITADNQMAIVGGKQGVAFYRLADGTLLHTLPGAAEDIAIGPHKRLLAVLHDGQVMLWGVGSAE
jgi:WD40 repeat protein